MRKIKALESLFLSCSVYLLSLFHKKTSLKQIDIVISDPRMEPYYYAILFSFLSNGYQLNLYVSWKWLAGTGKWIKFLLSNPLLHLQLGKPTGNNRVVTDKKNLRFSNQCFLNAAIYKNKPHTTLLPFPMHPEQYASGRYKNLEKYRIETNRPIRVVFSGNTIKEAYNSQVFADFFKIPSRWQVVQNLQNEFDVSKLKLINLANEWELARNGSYQNKIVMSRWEWAPQCNHNLNSRIPNTDWLITLGNSSFFIACPGIAIPQSHNCIEAMAVGAIPILSYAHLFKPGLQDGINCLVFKTEDQLNEKIKIALNMSEEKIAEMRGHVLFYYHNYLSLESCVNLLMNTLTSEVGFYNEVPINLQ